MPFNKRFLFVLVLLITIIFPASAAAADLTQEQQTAGLFFVESVEREGGEWKALNIMLFCNTTVNGDSRAIFITLGGNINIKGYIDGAVLSLFTKTVSTHQVKYGIINLKTVLLPFDLIVGLAAIAVFKEFYEQTSAYFVKNPSSVYKFGFYGYIMALLLIGIFFVSVSGAIIAIAGVLALAAAAASGRVAASAVLGYKLLDGRVKEYNIYTLFIAGSAVIDLFTLLPALGDFLLLVIIPALSLGIFSVHVIHKRFYREYVSMSFSKSAKGFDRGKMNRIILGIVSADGRGSK